MSDENESGIIDERRLTQMKIAILDAERHNLNTGDKSPDAMVDLVKKTIVAIADKTF